MGKKHCEMFFTLPVARLVQSSPKVQELLGELAHYNLGPAYIEKMIQDVGRYADQQNKHQYGGHHDESIDRS